VIIAAVDTPAQADRKQERVDYADFLHSASRSCTRINLWIPRRPLSCQVRRGAQAGAHRLVSLSASHRAGRRPSGG
jgi:hypothetical protein